jgi:hypothetical protein
VRVIVRFFFKVQSLGTSGVVVSCHEALSIADRFGYGIECFDFEEKPFVFVKQK